MPLQDCFRAVLGKGLYLCRRHTWKQLRVLQPVQQTKVQKNLCFNVMTRNRTYDMHDTAICTCPSQRPQKSQPPLKRSECPDSFNGTSTAMRPAAGFDASVFILCSALVGFLACGIGIGMCVDLGFFHSETGMQRSVPSKILI